MPHLVPQSEMTALGNDAWQQMLAENQQVSDPQVREFVAQVARRVVAHSPLRDQPVDIAVFAGEEVNAFALPGGHIGVYEGLLPVAQNAAGLAAILAHEVMHITEEHANERMSQQMLTEVALVGASEALADNENRGTILAALGLGTQVGVLLPYSRSQESEADVAGLEIMAAAGYDPREAVEVWQRMKQASGGSAPPAFLSTHPGTDDRIANLQDNMDEALRVYRNASQQLGEGERVPLVAGR